MSKNSHTNIIVIRIQALPTLTTCVHV